ncbi:MAG: PAS domain-containing protein [Candidatus Moraniibacteriota bacterium]
MEKQRIASIRLKKYSNKKKNISDNLRVSSDLMRERFLSLASLEQLPVSCWLPDTTLTFVNEAYRELIDKKEEELIGKKWIEMMPLELQAKTFKTYLQLAQEPKLHHVEYNIRRKDGKNHYVQWIDQPVLNKQGKVVEFLSIGKDITEQQKNRKIIENKILIQNVVATISSRFVGSFDFIKAAKESLADMGKLIEADRAYLFLAEDHFFNKYEWSAKNISSKNLFDQSSMGARGWWMKKLEDKEVIDIRKVSIFPQLPPKERENLTKLKIDSILIFPVCVSKKLVGFLGFDNIKASSENWNKHDLLLLRIAAEIFGNALELKQAENENQQVMKKVEHAKKEWEITVDALPQIICLLDQSGKIIRINKTIENWEAGDIRSARNQSIHEIFHPNCQKEDCSFRRDIENIWLQTLEGKSAEILHKSLQFKKTICIKLHPLKDKPNEYGYAAIGMIYDITEKVSANKKIFEMFKYLGIINRKVSILLGMNKRNVIKDAQGAYKHIVHASLTIASAATSILYRFDQASGIYSLLAADGYVPKELKNNFQFIARKSFIFADRVAKKGLRIQGEARSDFFLEFGKQSGLDKVMNTFLVIPLSHQGNLKGILFLGFKKRNNLSTQELEFYDLFSLQACLILMNVWEDKYYFDK